AAVAQEEGAGVTVGERLPLRGLLVHGTVLVEPHVAVGVDQARDDPALGDRLRARMRLVGDQPVHDVEVARLSVWEDRTPEAQCSHAGDAIATGGPRSDTESPSVRP